ncbi:MAG: hypothetical protein OEQ39_04460 [Gammaproteobacteria bacterium]|nr:hypothetical protein [Gammaproteobacteria bacterium]
MTINSRQKGNRGEREFAAFLREHGYEARRGQQFSGGGDSPDVVSNLPFHIEVKRTERFSLYPSMDQAKADAGDRVPIVCHRASHRPWVVVMDARDFLKLIGG